MKPFFTEADCDILVASTSFPRPVVGNSKWPETFTGLTVEKANRLLEERGLFMSVSKNDRGLYRAAQPLEPKVYHADTHKALLINIEPIEQDSAEKLVKALAEWQELDGTDRAREEGRQHRECLLSIVERAKALLGKK